MENLTEVAQRVDKYLLRRLIRWGALVGSIARDPRDPRGIRHGFVDCVLALLSGLAAQRRSLRDVEQLSHELGLGRRGAGISDGALSHLLGRCDEDAFDALLVRTVKDMQRRGELRHPGLDRPWLAIDGKYSALDHHCGGLGQKFEGDGTVYWRVGVLRAVMVSAPSRPAMGQWPIGPVETQEADADKIKHTGEITNLPSFIRRLREQYGDMASNFTLDAGLWSKALFLALDADGLGLLCALKDNKPDLMAEVERVLNIERRRNSPQAQSDWEPYRNGHIRRRLWHATTLDGWNGWRHMRQAVVIEQTTRDRDGKEASELRYFVTNATTGMLLPCQLLRLVRQHWSIENDCNWTFDMQFAEDDRAWCTQNTAILVLGVLRMVAYNLLQHLRKSHVAMKHRTAQPAPRPWRNLFEQIHRVLLRLGTDFGRLFRPADVRPPRPTAMLRASSSA